MIDYETDLKIHDEHQRLINADSAHEAYRKVQLAGGEAAQLDCGNAVRLPCSR